MSPRKDPESTFLHHVHHIHHLLSSSPFRFSLVSTSSTYPLRPRLIEFADFSYGTSFMGDHFTEAEAESISLAYAYERRTHNSHTVVRYIEAMAELREVAGKRRCDMRKGRE